MQDCKTSKLTDLIARLAHNQHRQLILLCGSHSWAANYCLKASELFQTGLVLSNSPLFTGAQWPEHLHQILGQEFDFALYDGYSGIVPNKLAALSGTVKAGGPLFLVLPELEDLEHWIDPAIDTWQSHGQVTTSSQFLKRWRRLLPIMPISIISETHDEHLNVPAKMASADSACFAEQSALIKTLTDKLTRKTAKPILLSADRGRGKSASLGLLAAQLPEYSFIICARQYQATKNSFKHLAQTLQISYQGHEKAIANLRFMPPDALLETELRDEILLVDEAAAIPVPILMQIQALNRPTLYASTLVGYEGNGRGYTLRFKGFLETHYPGFTQLSLETPIRYAPQDPLELTINRLFFLDCNYIEPEITANTELVTLTSAQLAQDDTLLQQVFSLLVIAHYQTTVNDLRSLLDHPNLRLYAVKAGSDILAVCMVSIEGALDHDIAQAIAHQGRRPKGHLLPQQLFHQLDQTCWLNKGCARIVRIAVAPECQNLGYGQQLLTFTEQQLADDVDYFGSSFGATSNLLNFWQNADYQLVKLGFKKDKASGEYAALVLKSSCRIQDEQQVLRQHFIDSLKYQLLTLYKALDPSLVKCIIGKFEQSKASSLALHCKQLHNKPQHIEQNLALLWQLLLSRTELLCHLSPISQQLAIKLILQGNNKGRIQQELKLDSKKRFNRALQTLVAEIYAQL